MYRSSFVMPLAVVVLAGCGFGAWRLGWTARAVEAVCSIHVTSIYCGHLTWALQ